MKQRDLEVKKFWNSDNNKIAKDQEFLQKMQIEINKQKIIKKLMREMNY